MLTLDKREDICQTLCFLSYEHNDLSSKISDAGAELLQTWPATNEGVRAFTARIPDDDSFVLVFRGTHGKDEWLQYLSIISNRYKPLENGEPSYVYALWIDILNEVSVGHAIGLLSFGYMVYTYLRNPTLSYLPSNATRMYPLYEDSVITSRIPFICGH